MIERSPSEPVTVGRVLSTHGVLGEIKVRAFSDVPHRFSPGGVLYLCGQPYSIASSTRLNPNQLVLKLQGVDAREAAQTLVGEWITVPEAAVPELPEGEYFHFQLLGLSVQTEEGEYLGQISEVLETGSNDVYIVSGPQGEVLIPALAQVIRAVDLAGRVMTVKLLEGLR